MVECGAEVHLYRRDSYKGYQIINGLNLIKPESVIASVQFHQSAIQASFMSDVLIGATSGYPIIDKNIINSVKKGCLVVDLGKNNLTKEATQYAAEQSVEIYRTDVTHSLVSYIYEVLKMEDILKNSYGKIDLGFCNIVGGGFFGNFGDVVVDNVNYPKQVIGISQGDGTLKSDLDDQDISVIKQLNMKYKIGK